MKTVQQIQLLVEDQPPYFVEEANQHLLGLQSMGPPSIFYHRMLASFGKPVVKQYLTAKQAVVPIRRDRM